MYLTGESSLRPMRFRLSTSMMRISLLFNGVLVLALYSVTLNYSTGVENGPHHVDGLSMASLFPVAAERNLTGTYPDKQERQSVIDPDDSTLEEGLCAGKDGVLLIQLGDTQSAVGTMFFIYVVNHLIYAHLHNLQPWIHLLPNPPCHDPAVHGMEPHHFQMLTGTKEEEIYGTGDSVCTHTRRNSYYPGTPKTNPNTLKLQNITIHGNGVFDTYFKSTGFPPKDPSCRKKPLLILNRRSVDPGMHFCAPWSAHPWPHRNIPLTNRPEGQGKTIQQWLQPMRQRASDQVRQYHKPLPWLQYHINKANPSSRCLSMHIRMTDKGNGRRKKPLSVFQAYAEAYAKASGGNSIYVATDDATVLTAIESEWKIASLRYQENTIRMNGGSAAIFHQFINETHRTNTEGFVDIYAMSKCDFFVYGFSAMAEATVYVNPELHDRSVNVDAPPKEIVSVKEFEKMVADHYGVQEADYQDFPPLGVPRHNQPIQETDAIDPVLREQVRVQTMFQEILHQNQHPQDCRKRRLLMTWRRPGPWDGFTLEIQDMGRRLMSALATDRTLIVRDDYKSAYAPEKCTYSTGIHVDATNAWECLYAPISNCSEAMTDWAQSAKRMDRVNSSLVSGVGIYNDNARSNFFSTNYYGNLRVIEGSRFGSASDIDRVEHWERTMGRFWVRSQTAAYLWKPSLGLQSEIDARLPRALLDSHVPYIGMHIRFTDNRLTFAKDFGRDPNVTKSLTHYMEIAEEIRGETNISTIYLATDSTQVMDELKQSIHYKEWSFHIQEAEVLRSDTNDYMWFKNQRSQMGASIATDVEVLRRADYLIGSFGSNVYRLVTQLNTAFMVDRYPLSRARHKSVDVDWYEDP